MGSDVPGAVKNVSKIQVLNARQKDVAAAEAVHKEINDSTSDPETKKPCKCGSTEHQRTSHKSCPLFRGTIKDRFKVGDEEESH